MALVIAIVAAAVGVVVGVIGLGAANEIDRTNYLAANARILKAVPVYPGAELLRSGVQARRLDGARIVGYATTAVYVLPPGATATAVMAFYRRRQSRAWGQEASLPARRYGGPVAQYRQGRRQLQIAVRKTKPHLVVTVDHDYY